MTTAAQDGPGTEVAASVVVPVRDVEPTIAEQLEALELQSFTEPWEIVVADHGSNDSTRDIVRGFKGRLARLRLVDASACRTVNEVRNLGASAATGALLAFCDGDDVVAPDWLEQLVSALQRYDLVCGSLEARRLNPNRTPTRPDPVADGPPVAMDFLPYAWGGNCGFHRHVWEELGGFDGGYPSRGEDHEFSWRAQLAGYQLGFAPDAVVHYRFRQGLWENIRQHYGYVRSQPLRYKRFREAGLRRSSLRGAALGWAWLLLRSPWLLRGSGRREQWLREAAVRLGRLVGSLRWRTLYL